MVVVVQVVVVMLVLLLLLLLSPSSVLDGHSWRDSDGRIRGPLKSGLGEHWVDSFTGDPVAAAPYVNSDGLL